MRVTLAKVASAIGRQFSACFQPLLFFLLSTFHRALRIFLKPGQPDQTARLAPPPAPPQDSCDDDETDNTDGGMASPSSAAPPPPKRAPVPRIIPALPRIPFSKKENTAPKAVAPVIQDAAQKQQQQLNERVARLQLNGGASSAGPAALGGTTGGAPAASIGLARQQQQQQEQRLEVTARKPSQKLVERVDNRQENVNAADVKGKGKAFAGRDETVQSSPPIPLQEPDLNATGAALAKVVPHQTPAQISHEVSQTSKLKETTIKLGEDTVQIQSKVETPEEAAERAIHSGFMREALDMVCLGQFFFFLVICPFPATFLQYHLLFHPPPRSVRIGILSWLRWCAGALSAPPTP
ncbi:hypothetical protein B0T17DRAFT_404799 [Bombardia bombarda]|uniref:Uncharacterized protein n=1 Tax=Bombardia bombarda TaxID=252184 RepID=A0AA39TZ59_9PEZI|nr:hypothetical protein B0T17DRAFT_404799 [Bombardia bombarda]